MNEIVMNALSTLGVPVSFQKYSGNASTYVTFFEYLQQGESFSEDAEDVTGHYIQVDMWSKGNYASVAAQAKRLLEDAGFKRMTEYDLYENDTGIYHKVMRFFYCE